MFPTLYSYTCVICCDHVTIYNEKETRIAEVKENDRSNKLISMLAYESLYAVVCRIDSS
jgi:hypothetical protein